tara:strand:+ start:1793 stop:3124 length:1332 start_codon:yes stop_codon:yes gene_type:complete
MRYLAILVLCTGLVAQSSDCTDILNQYTDDSSFWYGIGSSKIKRFGSNQVVDSASKKALENLSSKLNTRIESTALITTNETIKANRSKFLQKSSSIVRTFTYQNIRDYTIEYSSPCSKKQHMVVVALNKQSFFKNQEQRVRGLLIQVTKMLEGVDSFQNRLNKLDEFYIELMNVGRMEGVDERLSTQYAQALGKIISEYDQLLSDISIKIELSEPIMYHVDNNPSVVLKAFKSTDNKPISGLKVQGNIFNNETTNQAGIITKKWQDLAVKDFPVTVDVEVPIEHMVGDHQLFDSALFTNPTTTIEIKKQPLQLGLSYQIKDSYLLQRASSLTNFTLQAIFQKMSVETSTSKKAPYVIEVHYDQIYRSTNTIAFTENSVDVFKIEFNPVIVLKNTATNSSIFVKELGLVKATSYRSYENAYNKAVENLPILFEQTGKEIVDVLL